MKRSVATNIEQVRTVFPLSCLDIAALVPAAAAALRDLVGVDAGLMPVTSGVVVASIALADALIEHGDGVVSEVVGCPPRVDPSKSMLTLGQALAQSSYAVFEEFPACLFCSLELSEQFLTHAKPLHAVPSSPQSV